jgi:hypothetical protein
VRRLGEVESARGSSRLGGERGEAIDGYAGVVHENIETVGKEP